jgi:hypothetical protein
MARSYTVQNIRTRISTNLDESIVAGRRELRQQPRQRFVARDEFCDLLLSFKKLTRSDEPDMSVRGLLDVQSGQRYLIEQEKLFAVS